MILTGTISGNSGAFYGSDLNGFVELTFVGTVAADGSSASGTYSGTMGCTAGDKGTWTGARLAPSTNPDDDGKPTITAATEGATYTAFLSLGGYAAFFGNDLADMVYRPSSSYATELGSTQMLLCPSTCLPLELAYASPTQVNAVLPPRIPFLVTFGEFTSFPVDFEASNAAGSSGFFQATVYAFAPAVFVEGYDCSIDSRDSGSNVNCGLSSDSSQPEVRGAVTDTAGRLLSSSNMARLGDYYSIWLTGLGAFNSDGISFASVELEISNLPVSQGTTTAMTIAPAYLGPSSSYPGLYQINFQLPANTVLHLPCGTYNVETDLSVSEWDTSLLMQSIPVQLPVAIQPEDGPGCSQ